MTDTPVLSVLIPCYNEEANVEAIASAATRELERTGLSFEIVFIDNASTDRTVALLRAMCAHDPRIALIANTRNFGQMRSPTHGVLQARGQAIIGLCADFQDPPELIPEFVRRWQAGADIVLGVRLAEKTSALFATIRNVSYRLGRAFGDQPLIPNATGFGLYSRRAVDAIRALNEPYPFFRALLVETGFPIETIPYVRPGRAGGKSKNTPLALLDFAISGLAGSSKSLLRAPLYLAVLIGLGSLFALGHAGVDLALGNRARGWLFAAAIEAQVAILFGFLGLIGVQIALIADRTRGTPLVVERERINLPGR